MGCRCTLRQKSVGDGCQYCNLELAAELALDMVFDKISRSCLANALINRDIMKNSGVKSSLSRQAVSKWTRVPERHMHDVAKITGILVEELRPDIFRKK